MKTLAVLAALLALAGVAGATHGGDHPTVLSLTVPDLQVADEATISAVLWRAAGEPVENATIIFEVETTFGWLELGRDATNARGKASVLYTPGGPGAFTFRARFEGTPNLDPSEDTMDVSVASAPAAQPFPVATAIAFVVAIIVGSVWGAYGFVALELRRIWIEGGGTPFLNKRKEVRTK